VRIPKLLAHLFFVKMPYAVMNESGTVIRRSAIGKRKESKVIIENNQPSPQANNELTKEKMPVKRKSIPKAVACFGRVSNTVFIEALRFLRSAKKCFIGVVRETGRTLIFNTTCERSLQPISRFGER
jgi:hypothetical protein